MRRLPEGIVIATGAALKNPQRFADRAKHEGELPELGKPTKGMTHRQRALWEEFVKELPWLRESDRALVETAVHMRVRVLDDTDGAIGAPFFKAYSEVLSKLGATPGDRTKMPKGILKRARARGTPSSGPSRRRKTHRH